MTPSEPPAPRRSARRRAAGPLSAVLAVIATITAVSAITGDNVLLDAVRGITGTRPETPRTDSGAPSRDDIDEARARLPEIGLLDPDQEHGGYERDEFGAGWADTSGNGCPTRHDILARDLDDVDAAHDCTVRTGVLDDPYTGDRVHFTASDPQAVQIDHVVPLALAWRMGAAEWDRERRVRFANDPGNLVATRGDVNSDKGDSGPGDWQPYEGYRCSYAVSYVAITHDYELSLTSRDHGALERTLEHCA